MIVPKVYDFPRSLHPAKQLFNIVQASTGNGFTVREVMVEHPEPSGRARLTLEYGQPLAMRGKSLLDYSWLASKLGAGNVFRIKLWNCPQLVNLADAGMSGAEALIGSGVPWGDGTSFSDGSNWAYDPGVFASSDALEGTMKITVNMGDVSPVLRSGHVIGHMGSCYKIDEVEYSGSQAEITLMLPLRRDVSADDFISFRPTMTGTAQDPEQFRQSFESADIVRPGSIVFKEAIL